jgi:hypothetical protein
VLVMKLSQGLPVVVRGSPVGKRTVCTIDNEKSKVKQHDKSISLGETEMAWKRWQKGAHDGTSRNEERSLR